MVQSLEESLEPRNQSLTFGVIQLMRLQGWTRLEFSIICRYFFYSNHCLAIKVSHSTVSDERLLLSSALIEIQVPKATAEILQSIGYDTKCRGIVSVKGKGDMET